MYCLEIDLESVVKYLLQRTEMSIPIVNSKKGIEVHIHTKNIMK